MTEDKESKGKQLIAEAEGKLNVSSGICCKSTPKVEEAAELYVKAANSFKMSKSWILAGSSFAEAAALLLNKKRLHEAGEYYVEASKCYKKENAEESLKCLLHAITVYTDMGRSKVAAKHEQTVAELYEELKDMKNAIVHYGLAAELFQREESKSASNKCLLKVAEQSALMEDYEKAIEIYEKIGRSALESSLLRYCTTDLFLRAAMCHLCIDVSRVNNGLLERFDEMNPAFEGSRERTLVRDMAVQVAKKDLDGFNEAVRSYGSISLLDSWYTEIIRRIRKQIVGYTDLR